MPSIIRVAFRSKNPRSDIRSSFDLGRELISLGLRLQAEAHDTWAATEEGVITEQGRPIGDYLTEDAPWSEVGGDACCPLTATAAGTRGLEAGVDLIEHWRCQEHRDGVVTGVVNGETTVVYEPPFPSRKGRVRV